MVHHIKYIHFRRTTKQRMWKTIHFSKDSLKKTTVTKQFTYPIILKLSQNTDIIK